MRTLSLTLSYLGLLVLSSSAWSQVTLSGGDHIIPANLAVGVTGTTGNITVTGSTGNSASPGLSITGDGGVLFTGSFGVGQISATGAGTRFMWYPKKAAVRAGRVFSTEWNDANIGTDSVAFGTSQASGDGSVGLSAYAIGTQSVALGGAVTTGDYTLAIGPGAMADGLSAMAMGDSSYASGEHSLACGFYSWAAGNRSFSSGYQCQALASDCYVIGRANAIEGTEDGVNWVASDPLFVLGNGTGDWLDDAPEVASHNALVVRKNGDLELTGKVTMPRQGDIPMGDFGNPE